MNRRFALVIAALLTCGPAIAQANTTSATTIPPKFEDCDAVCKLRVAKMACGKEDLLATPADVEKMSTGATDYPSLIARLGSNCGRSATTRTRQVRQDVERSDEDDVEPASQERPVDVASGYGRGHHGGAYQGDRDLLRLNSLGPRGRVVMDRRAPGGAIPCIVKGRRGMCVPR